MLRNSYLRIIIIAGNLIQVHLGLVCDFIYVNVRVQGMTHVYKYAPPKLGNYYVMCISNNHVIPTVTKIFELEIFAQGNVNSKYYLTFCEMLIR